MNTKETWIDETLNSLDGIRRAKADPDLFRKIQPGIALPQNKSTSFKQITYWSVAAGLALLVTLNVMVTLNYQKTTNRSSKVPEALASDYLSYLGPIKL
ncbi:MAG: hypothetical protein WCK34_09375 [Bacteroidota bacterium]